MASRTDQIIGPIALSSAREIGLDPESEDQQLHMMVWLISAHPSKFEGLNLRWPVSFKTLGNNQPDHNTLLSGDSGQDGVAEDA